MAEELDRTTEAQVYANQFGVAGLQRQGFRVLCSRREAIISCKQRRAGSAICHQLLAITPLLGLVAAEQVISQTIPGIDAASWARSAEARLRPENGPQAEQRDNQILNTPSRTDTTCAILALGSFLKPAE